MVTIEHFKMLTQSKDALRLAAAGFSELATAGWVNGIALHHSYSAILAASDLIGPVGVLVWSDIEDQNQLWVQMAYTAPEYRRKGIHKRMFEALTEKAKELKRPYIGSGVHADNLAMLCALNKEGREIVGVVSRYEVKAD